MKSELQLTIYAHIFAKLRMNRLNKLSFYSVLYRHIF